MTSKWYGSATGLAAGAVVTAVFLTPVFGVWIWVGTGLGLWAGKKCVERLKR